MDDIGEFVLAGEFKDYAIEYLESYFSDELADYRVIDGKLHLQLFDCEDDIVVNATLLDIRRFIAKLPPKV